MLELRPSCEHCNTALPPNSTKAMICSFECTFCNDCVAQVLQNVCPNCGGGFVSRPIRPSHNLKNDNFLGKHPATSKVTFKPVIAQEHEMFAQSIKKISPELR